MSIVLPRGAGRTWSTALRALVLVTAVTVVYTAAVGLVALLAPYQAHGSQVTAHGRVVGSALLGQGFVDRRGDALPQWFQSRPSAAGGGWDGGASSASNLGPNSPDLVKAIADRKAAERALDGPGTVPPDALTASGSGLDPHISPAYALRQVDRVARTRGIAADRVRALVRQHVQAPDLGFLGQPTVNVLQLNLALSAADPAGDAG